MNVMKQKQKLSLWPVMGHRQTSQPVKIQNKRVLSIEKQNSVFLLSVKRKCSGVK